MYTKIRGTGKAKTVMEHRPLVSVIVPVYNAEAYLEECLKSIINQTYEKLEILVVDDGSTDRSPEICDEFAGRDSRVNVQHQKNAGAAAARKKGVLCAKGSYICFVDADDRADISMIENLLGHIGGCDMITAGFYRGNGSGEYIRETDNLEEGIYDTEETMKYFIANMLAYKNRFEYGVLPFLWNKMYKAKILKSVIKNMKSEISFGEDTELLFRYILNCRAVQVTHMCLYYYCDREDSISRSEMKDYMCSLFQIYVSLEKAFKNHPQESILMHQLQLYITSHIYGITEYMGFSNDTRLIRYAFPFPELKKDSKVILYGAGRTGTDYYRQIFKRKLANLVLWVDKRWEEYKNDYTPVFSPENIVNYEYDYLIIAVAKEKLAENIRKELIRKGVSEDKIVWRLPIIV